jgi:hypothetical protein
MIRCLFLAGSLLAGQVDSSAGGDLKTEVGRLVGQLDSPKLDQREAAEAELLRRGPAILELLPPVTDRTPAEIQQRLGRIRQKLQHLAADAAAGASAIALHADAMPLSRVLAAFQSQSGNAIVDYRRQFGQPATDPELKIAFDKTPFWPAFDRLLDQAGLTLYPYSEQRALNVVAAAGTKRIARAGSASYSGPFRFEPVAVVARRDLRTANGQSLVVTLEAAWEPRLRIISLMHRMADVRAVDERDNPLPVADSQVQQEVPVGSETISINLDLPLRLPPREVQQIANLKGRLLATIPGKIETFRFAQLVGAKNLQQRIAGVTVTLEQVQHNHKAATGGRAADTTWEVRMRVRFDDAGDALASHRTWIFNNEARLESADGKSIAYDGFETTLQSKNEVGVAYLFPVDRPISQLSFIYKTPGTIITSGLEYELRDIRLP